MEITKEDVLEVAKSINKILTTEQIDDVLERYESEAENDETATWNLIVENLIYNCG